MAVGQYVVLIPGTHDAGTGQGQSHPRGVNGYPAPTPLFGDISGGAGPASGVEHEVAGVGGHEDTAFDYPLVSLNYINLSLSPS